MSNIFTTVPPKAFATCGPYHYTDENNVTGVVQNTPMNMQRCLWFRPHVFTYYDTKFPSILFMFDNNNATKGHWCFDTAEQRDDVYATLLRDYCA